MTDNAPVRSAQGYAEITQCAHVNHGFVFREDFRKTVWHVAHTSFGDLHTGRAWQRVFKVLAEILVLKKRQRAGTKIGKTFRHERETHVKSFREMLHERTEKLCARRSRSLDDGTEQFLGAIGRVARNLAALR